MFDPLWFFFSLLLFWLGLVGPGGRKRLVFGCSVVVPDTHCCFLLLEEFWEAGGATGLFIFGLDFLGARLPAGV
jgi:hypothetical protein